MFKTYLTYLILLALTLQSFHRIAVVIDYKIHTTNYLAHCQNKNRPTLHCDGQCVLMKKIREKEEKEAKKEVVTYDHSSLYVHNEYSVINLHSFYDEEKESLVPYAKSYRFEYSYSIFHPPLI